MTSAQVVLYALLAGGGLWVLHKIGQFLTKLLEAAAAIAVVFLTRGCSSRERGRPGDG